MFRFCFVHSQIQTVKILVISSEAGTLPQPSGFWRAKINTEGVKDAGMCSAETGIYRLFSPCGQDLSISSEH
jgi:hypothetical protein